MKKLNKKGFTLIELLAVIVILAIIVVVTVPTILNSINDARLSSISSLSKEVANQYDTAVAQDLIAPTGKKTLGDATISYTIGTASEWYCFDSLTDSTKGKLTEILDLSTNDLKTGGTKPEGDNPKPTENSTCSAIRIGKNGSAEVLLVATNSGKFGISGKVVYALSTAENGKDDGIKATS